MTQVGVGVFHQGSTAAPPLTPTPPVATKLLSEGLAPRRSYFYLFTVCASSSRFLPALPQLCPPPRSLWRPLP